MANRLGLRAAAPGSGGHARGRTWWFGIVVGGLLIALGAAETVRLVRSGDGGFVFWFGTLVGGGLLVLSGTLLLPRRPTTGCVLTVAGCVAGLLPTMWTVLAPFILIALAVTVVNQTMSAETRTEPE